jgi:hypothetical protein
METKLNGKSAVFWVMKRIIGYVVADVSKGPGAAVFM